MSKGLGTRLSTSPGSSRLLWAADAHLLLTLACLLLVLYTTTALHMYTLGMSYRLTAPIRCDGALAGTAWCGQSRVHFKG